MSPEHACIVSDPKTAMAKDDSREPARVERRWRFAGFAFCVLMLGVHVAAALNAAGVPDFWRDIYWATAIAHGERFPLAGPQIYHVVELGPWWFYLLALPMFASGSVVVTMAFIQALAAIKYFLAWRIGICLAGARLGLAFAASLAVAGWSMVPLLFPSHPALVETCILLLGIVAWRCANRFSIGDAIWLGLASAACLHAHPTTASYVVCAGAYVLWKQRSRPAFGAMCISVAIVALALLPPWLDRSVPVDVVLTPVSAYVGGDIGVNAVSRMPAALRGIVTGGAWWGPLLMTPWNADTARLAWWVSCASLLLGLIGLALLHPRHRQLRGLAGLATLAFVAQIAFLVMVRPTTPMWMVSSCLPPLALAIGIAWFGWLDSSRRALRIAGSIALCVHLALALAPYSLLLRDLRSLRTMPGANPLHDVIEDGDRYVNNAVAFYPIRRIQRLSASLCAPMVLHARLASVIEQTYGSTIRNACGRWPRLRYGGIEGPGGHVAGLLAHTATASGITPTRVVSGMAIYERVRPIAPPSGGRSTPLTRLQIHPDTATGPSRETVFDFETDAADVVVLTNRRPYSTPFAIEEVAASHLPARQLDDDGGSILYRCAACPADSGAHWHIVVRAVEANLDLVVLLHKQAGAEARRTASR